MATNYRFKHFVVRFPSEYQYVAHVEINRADKMNAFFEACVPSRPYQEDTNTRQYVDRNGPAIRPALT